MSQGEITIMQFLNDSLVRDMRHAVSCGLYYYVFPLICQAIELMGALFDSRPLEDYHQSRSRFTRAMGLLFDDRRYKENRDRFYENLRGWMVHQFRIGPDFALTSSENQGMAKSEHFRQLANGAYILVVEVFIDDFEKALAKLSRYISGHDPRIDISKLRASFFYYGPAGQAFE